MLRVNSIVYREFTKKILFSRSIEHIPSLSEFMKKEKVQNDLQKEQNGKQYFLKTYGCQMNVNDSQIITSILQQAGYQQSKQEEDAEIVLLNTCAIREHAENKIITKINMLKKREDIIIGVLGCMAERMKTDLWSQGADIVAGPDSYRRLPQLIEQSQQGKQADVQLSWEETYEDFQPTIEQGSKESYVSIMRGCNNMCSFCIVPFTRGRERSRSPVTIIQEVQAMADQGVKQITLLGQNVNSYFFPDEGFEDDHKNTEGFKEMYKLRSGKGIRFANLLKMVAEAVPNVRFRFTSPHPKDFPDQVLEVIRDYPNIAKQLHIPCQSGSTSMLSRMRRFYSRESFIQLCLRARQIIPNVALSTDVIVGFCDETEEEFQETLSLMDEVKFEQAFMFAYSMRERTHAHRNFVDNVLPDIKQQRLETLINTVHKHQQDLNQQEIGKLHLVLVESNGKKQGQFRGRSDSNKTVVIDQIALPQFNDGVFNSLKNWNNSLPGFSGEKTPIYLGDFVLVSIKQATLKTLVGEPICKCSMQDFDRILRNQQNNIY